MNKTRNTSLILVIAVIVVFFLYFSNGTILDGGMNGSMHKNGWMNGISWRWVPSIFTLAIGVFIGWLLPRKKK